MGERHWTSKRKKTMTKSLIIISLLCIGVIYGYPIVEDEYDDEAWMPWLERSMIPVPNYNDINNQKRLMVPMPKIKLPDLSKLKLQESFVGQQRRGKRLMLPMGRMPDVGLNLSKFQVSRNG